jgi:type IV pilus assembly protein PilC
VSGINIKEFSKGREQVTNEKSSSFDIKKILETDIKLFPVKFTDKNKESFYLELSTLLKAGLDIKSALELIEEEQEKPKHKEIIHKVKEDLVNGASLWEALQQSGYFTPYEYYSVQIGEETGKTNLVLDQLYQFYHVKLKQRRQFISALSYPVIILFTSIGAVSFMLLFIVPMFNDVFKRFGGDLPYITKVIINVSGAIKSNIFWVVPLIGIIVYYIYKNRNKEWMLKFSAKAVSKIPVIGKIIYAIQLARFCSSMSLLLGSKVPIIRSLGLIKQMITFYPIQITLQKMGDDIMNGKSLHSSMAEFNVYNRKMVSLIKVGEEVNKLDVFFEKLSSQFSNDVEHQTSLLNTFLEPAMIIFLGVVVGFILLAMYMPMFQMSTTIGG